MIIMNNISRERERERESLKKQSNSLLMQLLFGLLSVETLYKNVAKVKIQIYSFQSVIASSQ